MGTGSISPLCQRMIEDMSARKLGPQTQKSHISSCKRVSGFLKCSPPLGSSVPLRAKMELVIVFSTCP